MVMILVSSTLFAQYSLSGVVTSSETGEKLIGANVFLKNTTIGAASDENGKYSVSANVGTYTVVCSYVGFETQEVSVKLNANTQLNFVLKERAFSLSVTVLADRAKERETPVAFTNVDKKQMEFKLGSRDIPLVLNTTPSVYSTENGGGSGDARISVRGFNQRNVAIMINGVPINDMENGWVYWSNWDGLGDATSSIQVQRGLSAVNLATPSIGGTMNIITDPTALKFGVKFKQEFGSGSFLKSTFSANSGLLDGKWAFSGAVVRKVGDGVIDKAWTDAWAYYFGAAYNLNESNRLEMYLVGAPQQHGQNSYKQNIGTYSKTLAKDLGYNADALSQFPEAESGRLYNQTWNKVSSSYKGQQWYTKLFSSDGEATDRHDPSFINERQNYFHKPIANLNWYSLLSKDLSLYTTVYWSGGHGGGTGTIGSMKYDYTLPNSRRVDWDASIANNLANVDANGKIAAKGILRGSRNNQYTIGAISKAFYKVSDNFKTSVGIDWRTASIDHYRDVVDMLGADYYNQKSSYFWGPSGKNLVLGDKFNYYNTNDVNWIGGYVQGEYTMGQISAYATAGVSTVKYKYSDHFRQDGSDSTKVLDGVDDTNNQLVLESDNIAGYQVKGGVSYRLTTTWDVYFNTGYVSKVPSFDQVINDASGKFVQDQKNEKFVHFEVGSNWKGLDGKLDVKGNFYYTTWSDRSTTVTVFDQNNQDGLITLNGISSRHTGFELEAAYQPIQMIRLDVGASFGNWKYVDDISGQYETYKTDGTIDVKDYNYYIKSLKVGDQPQTQFAIAATFYPVDGLSASIDYKYFADHYAEFDPFSRNVVDRAQSWKTPNYGIVDFHFAYNLPFDLQGIEFQLFGHIFNLLDELYVTDAVDNSRFSAYKIDTNNDGKRDAIAFPHTASAAEVFVGLPRTFNLGISAAF